MESDFGNYHAGFQMTLFWLLNCLIQIGIHFKRNISSNFEYFGKLRKVTYEGMCVCGHEEILKELSTTSSSSSSCDCGGI